MQAVILAAGKGTRMRELTKKTPKPMLKILDQNLLEIKINHLPKEVDEVVLVVGYKAPVIKKHFKNNFNGRKITYVEDKLIAGTAMALWQAKNILKDKFLVLMGDDIYSQTSLAECAKNPLSICCRVSKINERGDRALIKNKNLAGFTSFEGNLKLKKPSDLAFTGMYCLTKDIFKYKPVPIKNGEFGLPHTLLKMTPKNKVKIIKTKHWMQISSPEDLVEAEKLLKKWPKKELRI